MKILVLPDIHGRNFWRKPCENIEGYNKVIFLGDYLDPYGFEDISEEDSIDNFKDILLFAKDIPKVVMLLGNHDEPYASDIYYGLSSWHCRHSQRHHKEINDIFKTHEDCFRLAYSVDDILFTHAGCVSGWLDFAFDYKYNDRINLEELCNDINEKQKTKEGLCDLYMVSSFRGGYESVGSCLWADVHEMIYDTSIPINADMRQHPIHQIKQIFGHTLQAFKDKDEKIIYGKPIEFRNCKMLDNACAYELDTETFTIKNLTQQ